jgi:N-carbamoyl-L-amino-acid hydrolase
VGRFGPKAEVTMLKINATRLLGDLNALAQIGGTAEGGVNRPALSAADAAGRDWFRRRIADAGFDPHEDGAGNLSAVLPCADQGARTLLIGSHLDTVPDGGRYDGALGTLAALEMVRTLREAGVSLPFHLEAIAFTDEEGTHLGLMGSRALSGQLTGDALAAPRSGGPAFAEGLARLGLTHVSILGARRDPASLAGYIELHIEQGTRLERAGVDIGVVTSIVGIRSFWLHFGGRAAHAGTMPMASRADALWGAAWFVMAARRLVMEEYHPGVVNCGEIELEPGAFNIVPGDVRLALEFRHSSEALLDEMEAALLGLAGEAARKYGLTLTTRDIGGVAAAPMSEGVITAIERAANSLGLSHTRLISFAGHDAQALSTVTPAAMLFVPSVGGISHHAREFTTDQDVINGANTLLHAVLAMAEV